MALTDITEPTQPVIKLACDNIRRKLGVVLDHTDVTLQQIRSIVNTHGRLALATELEADATSLLRVYNSLKDAVEIGKEVSVSELPE